VAAVIVELAGSSLVIFGRWVRSGAGGLGVPTTVAMVTANNFWTTSGRDRCIALNDFFEHLGLIARFVLFRSCVPAILINGSTLFHRGFP
jgi:uncharacterized membrane protein YphA (DoxX/SURF4 family)